VDTAQGLFFARGTRTAEFFARQLASRGEVRRPDLGLDVIGIERAIVDSWNLPKAGVLVREIPATSVAWKLGMRKFDFVHTIEYACGCKQAITDKGALDDALGLISAGETVKIRFLRFTEVGMGLM